MLPTAFTSQQRKRKRRRLARGLSRPLAGILADFGIFVGFRRFRRFLADSGGFRRFWQISSVLADFWGRSWVLAGGSKIVNFRRFWDLPEIRNFGGGKNSRIFFSGGVPPPGKSWFFCKFWGRKKCRKFGKVLYPGEPDPKKDEKKTLARFGLFFSLSRDLALEKKSFGLDHGRVFFQKLAHRVVLGGLRSRGTEIETQGRFAPVLGFLLRGTDFSEKLTIFVIFWGRRSGSGAGSWLGPGWVLAGSGPDLRSWLRSGWGQILGSGPDLADFVGFGRFRRFWQISSISLILSSFFY